MPITPDGPDNLVDLAAFRAQVAAAMAAEGVDHDRTSSVPGDRATWAQPGMKPLPLHPVTSAPTLFRVRAGISQVK